MRHGTAAESSEYRCLQEQMEPYLYEADALTGLGHSASAGADYASIAYMIA